MRNGLRFQHVPEHNDDILHGGQCSLEMEVLVLYKLGRKFVEDCTARSHLNAIEFLLLWMMPQCTQPLMVLSGELHQSL